MAKLAGSRPINVKVELPSDSKQHSTKVKSTVRSQRDASSAGVALQSGSVRHHGCVDLSSPANLAGEESMPSKVLIVDDDKTTREGLAEFLEEAGYEAVAVGTFEDATRILRSSPPDLLIADVRLGPFNGLQLVISSPKPIPAIIITGFADPVLEADARRRGADYVLKPVSPARLLDLVAQKLASPPGLRFGTPRRWERKPVIGGLPISVDDTPARIIDVSYGGLRFEMQRNEESAARVSQHHAADSATLCQGQTRVGESDRRQHLDVRCGALSGNARVAGAGRRDLIANPSPRARALPIAFPTTRFPGSALRQRQTQPHHPELPCHERDATGAMPEVHRRRPSDEHACHDHEEHGDDPEHHAAIRAGNHSGRFRDRAGSRKIAGRRRGPCSQSCGYALARLSQSAIFSRPSSCSSKPSAVGATWPTENPIRSLCLYK